MKNFKRIVFMMGLFVLAVYLVLPVFTEMNSLSAWAAQPLLAQKHQKSGVQCSGCHKEMPPKSNVTMAACFQCHGDYAKIAERTKILEKNPHSHHLDELECDKCHHVHKASIDYCAQCHKFGFKVP